MRLEPLRPIQPKWPPLGKHLQSIFWAISSAVPESSSTANIKATLAIYHILLLTIPGLFHFRAGSNQDLQLIEGFGAQADKLAATIDAVIGRSVKERASIIIEGIHILPEYHRRVIKEEAVVVPNTDPDETVRRTIGVITHQLAQRFL